MLILRGGQVVIGDGSTDIFRGSVLMEGNRIAAVTPQSYRGGLNDTVVELDGRLVMPGAIDPHAHAVAPGPRFASGTPGVSREEALGNLRRHLSQGHTTVVDLDGFKVPTDTDEVRRTQPVRVESATVHFDPMWRAADAVDGSGLEARHRDMSAGEMAESGACVVGEVGAGMTLGGGGQDYMYIPAAIERATGVRVRSSQAAQLKYAVLGRHIRPGAPDRGRIQQLLTDYGLASALDVDHAVELIEGSVLPSLQLALDGVVESARVATNIGLPAIVHNSAPSDEATRAAVDLAGPLLIAGHSNHSTFTLKEALDSAQYVRDHGGVVEVDTFDSWGRRELDPTPATLLTMVAQGLVDLLATDYAAGWWDGVFEAVEEVWRSGAAPLTAAVALATGNVARSVPRIGQSRGLLRAGLLGDVVVSHARHPSLVELVVIGGEIAFAPTYDGVWPAGER